jgi:NAD-dependent SIR2 family protein deacetylase
MIEKKLVIFNGAGLLSESGIPTFRDPNAVWENYKIEDVAALNEPTSDKQLTTNTQKQ